jgi:hypothetical protein
MKLFLSVAVLCAGLTVRAQQPVFEYGRPAEMRGMTRFFLDTQGDMKRRDQIAQMLRKKLPELVLTERAGDAEATILYTEDLTARFVKGTSVNDRSCEVQVFVRLSPEKVRLLFSYSMKKKNVFQHEPYKNFAEEFVKAYKDANADLSKNPYYRQMTGKDKKPN